MRKQRIQDTEGSVTKRVVDLLVDHRLVLVLLVIAITVLFGLAIPGLKVETGLSSVVSTNSPDYRYYRSFLEQFVEDDFVLIAVKTDAGVGSPEFLRVLGEVTQELESDENVTEVISIANLKVPGTKGDLFGFYSLVREDKDSPRLPEREELDRIGEAFPLFDLFLSRDSKTAGIIVRIDSACKFDPECLNKVLSFAGSLIERSLPENSEYRIVGAPVLWSAFHRYCIGTAILYSFLGLVIGSLVGTYVAKSIKYTAIVVIAAGVAASWVLGVMSLTGIKVNPVTSPAFSIIIVLTATSVIHMISQYYEQYRKRSDHRASIRHALYVVFSPCLMSALTTAVGFGSIVAAPVPILRQLGLIMSAGVLSSFILAVILTPTFMLWMNPLGKKTVDRMSRDWVSVLFEKMGRFVFAHPKLGCGSGALLVAVMLLGLSGIRVETKVLHMLTDSTPEIQAIRFAERNLGPVYSLEVVVEAKPGAFKTPEAWRRVRSFEKALKELPEIGSVDSLVPMLEYLRGEIAGRKKSSGDVFENGAVLSEMLSLMTFHRMGKRLLRRHLDNRFGTMRISARIMDSPDTQIVDTMQKIQSLAEREFRETANVRLTGLLSVFARQDTQLVKSQIFSLIVALSAITVLMVIQFRSVRLGLLSLIPNVVPLVTVFGTMGWMGIELDMMTIFVASASIGLSVDDTIHYLHQFRTQIARGGPGLNVAHYLIRAYRTVARALISTSVILFFTFMVLTFSPFTPQRDFGILCAIAMVAALVGDLVLLPSIILTVPFIRRWFAGDSP